MRWQPGQNGNPAGRTKGSKQAFSEAVVRDLMADWREHGVDAIQRVRESNRAVYLQTVARLIPKRKFMQPRRLHSPTSIGRHPTRPTFVATDSRTIRGDTLPQSD